MPVATVVADAWALLAWMRGEGEAVRMMRRLLRRAGAGNLRMALTLVTLGEVYYRLIQLLGQREADERMASLRRTAVDILPVRELLVFEAARIKARFRLSYADAFVVAAARMERAPVLTGDPEILALPREVVRVRQLYR